MSLPPPPVNQDGHETDKSLLKRMGVRRATERILVVEIKFKPYIQVRCLCLNPSDGESLANFHFEFFNFELREL
jgi:hypothetical protein